MFHLIGTIIVAVIVGVIVTRINRKIDDVFDKETPSEDDA